MNTISASSLFISGAFLAGAIAGELNPKFRQQEIDNKIAIGYGLAVADINGDKKTDIALADKNHIVWYENPSWQKHVIAERLTALDHVCIAARDLDGDGKAEIAAGAGWNPGDTVGSGSLHYLVPPADRTQPWTPITLPHEPTVHRMKWLRDWQGRFQLVVAPLHGRGNKNGEGEGVKILAYQLPADPKDTWTTRVLDQSLHMTHNFDAVQWDDDENEEIVVAAKEGLFVINWVDGAMKAIKLGGNPPGAGEVRLGKGPGARRFMVSIEPMHGNQLVLYTPPAGEGEWTRAVLDETLVDGHALVCADFINQGSQQVVAGWRAMRGNAKVGVRLYIPSADLKEWRQVMIDDNTMACEDLATGDFNGDGRIDLVAAGRATKNVKIYFNESQ